jgi:exopolysaccharide production protein ExoZ
MVMLFHLLPGHFVLGSAGVDIFFAISGFIMGTVGIKEAPGEFMIKRLARIAPLYWLVTLTMCLGCAVGVFRNFTFSFDRIVYSLLFIPYFNPQGKIWPLLIPGWTLNYEMFFYLVFALGLAVRRPLGVTVLALLAATGSGLLLAPHSPAMIIWTSPMLLEFLGGLVLAQACPRLAGAGWGVLLLAAGVLALGGSAVTQHLLGGDYRVLCWGLPALAIVTGALMIEQGGRWPSTFLLPLERIGDFSYSLYLLHGLVIAVGLRVLGGRPLALALIAALSIAASIASYRLIENPSAKGVRRLIRAARNGLGRAGA